MADYKCGGCGKPIHCFTDEWDGCSSCGCVTAEKVRQRETAPVPNTTEHRGDSRGGEGS